jgi:hypothetical protein
LHLCFTFIKIRLDATRLKRPTLDSHFEDGAFAEHRHHAQVLRPVLDEDEAQGQLFGKRWIDNQLGRCFVFRQTVTGRERP